MPIRLSLLLLLTLLCSPAFAFVEDEKPKLILDADTANEIDDMYAIVRMLRQDKFDVLALTSTQWIHYLAEDNSVGASQRENESLVKLLGADDLPTPIGSKEPMGKPWGGEQPKDSPAAQFIIKSAKAASPKNKLVVVCLGATTNLASAIKMAPAIAKNIDAYVLGFKYDFEKDVWNKATFNTRRDLNAADYVLNCKELKLTIMPSNVAKPLTFPRDNTFERHKKMGPLGTHLTAKWNARFADFKNWVMWDLALVEAILDPSLATMKTVRTPPENVQREIQMYDSIEVQSMREDYWRVALGDAAIETKYTAMNYEQLLGEFKPYPDKCDMMVVVAHPDDEGYLGGMLTHYTQVLKKKVVIVCLTSGEWGNGMPHHKAGETPDYSYNDADYPRYEKVPKDATYPSYFREEEMARSMLVYGVQYRPIMPRYKDMSGLQPWGGPNPGLAYWGKEKVVSFVTSQIRRFQPDVVVTLPVDGANGNPLHCAASRAAVLAFDAAGDKKRFSSQLDKLKPWTSKKLYLRISEAEYEAGKYKTFHTHTWDTMVPGVNETVRTIAARANAQHISQEMKNECDAVTRFFLANSNVGDDKLLKDDLLQNVPE